MKEGVVVFLAIFISGLVFPFAFALDYHYEPSTSREIIVEVPIELREFSGVAELEHWLAHRDTTIYLKSGADFSNYDCDDYARDLVAKARQDGYDVGIELDGDHILNNTIIGNSLFYIEPTTGELWEKTTLD